MNSFSSIYARMNERTKLIIVAVVAFWLGGLLKGSGSSTGRYQPCGNSPTYVLDTQKGTAWELKGTKYQEMGSMPW
jgi:lipopolysaccharide export system protein LptC